MNVMFSLAICNNKLKQEKEEKRKMIPVYKLSHVFYSKRTWGQGQTGSNYHSNC